MAPPPPTTTTLIPPPIPTTTTHHHHHHHQKHLPTATKPTSNLSQLRSLGQRSLAVGRQRSGCAGIFRFHKRRAHRFGERATVAPRSWDHLLSWLLLLLCNMRRHALFMGNYFRAVRCHLDRGDQRAGMDALSDPCHELLFVGVSAVCCHVLCQCSLRLLVLGSTLGDLLAARRHPRQLRCGRPVAKRNSR